MGYLPAALRNYLVRLGWSHGDQEIFSTQEMIDAFDLSGIGRSAARFDFAKLENLNGHYIRHADDQSLVTMFEDVLNYVPERADLKAKLNDTTRAQLLRAMPSLKERAKTLIELIDSSYFIFADRPLQIEPKAAALLTPENRELIGRLRTALEAVTPWTAETTEAAMRSLCRNQQPQARRGGPAAAGGADRAHHLAGDFRRPGGAGPGGMPGPAGRSGCRLSLSAPGIRLPRRGSHAEPAILQRTQQYDTHLSRRLLDNPACPRHLSRNGAQSKPGFRNDFIGDFTMDAKSSTKTATLTVGNKTYDFPILSGTVGPDVIDIAKLYAQAGMFTYDPGFTSTGSCQSKITYIDGDAGILEYRGYPIEQLAEHGDFLETCYLLLYGELPTKAQKEDFDQRVIHHTMVHEQMARFFQGFRRDAHPMAIMVAAVGALAAFYHDSTDINDPQQRMIASMRMIAKIPTLAAMAFKYTIGQPFMYPKNSLCFAENFLHMCFAVPCEEYKINPVLANALDKIFILHADHEQNASTSTVRIAGSSGANPFACIAAGIACLWGPAHGGANEAALAMLAEIGSVDKIPEFIKKVKDKNSEVRLMGFGHRVYKNYDPRAKIMQKMCHAVLAETGHGDDPMLKVALELEKIALHDEYFIERKLYPNVDFYSGITLKAMGFPTSMFTVLFAVARTVGWISQWSEMIEDPQQKIGRPRQLYTGVTRRDYVDIAKRK